MKEFNLAEYLSFDEMDIIQAEMDFYPFDNIDNIETTKGIFIKYAINIPAGHIPLAYILLKNGFAGWVLPYRIVDNKKICIITKIKSAKEANADEIEEWHDLLDVAITDIENSISVIKSISVDIRKYLEG
jgi:hypothetical protein